MRKRERRRVALEPLGNGVFLIEERGTMSLKILKMKRMQTSSTSPSSMWTCELQNTCNKMLNSSVLYIWNLENMSIKQEEHEIFDYIYETTRLRNASKLNKSCYSIRDNWSRKTNKFNRSYPYSTNLKANNWNNITSQIWHIDN